MLQPLALVLYEKLLPGSQLVNRLQDLKYRVQTLADADFLVQTAAQAKPMVVLVDLEWQAKNIFDLIRRLKQDDATRHLPVIGFCREDAPDDLRTQAAAAGVDLSVSDTAILNHLPQLLDQAIQLE